MDCQELQKRDLDPNALKTLPLLLQMVCHPLPFPYSDSNKILQLPLYHLGKRAAMRGTDKNGASTKSVLLVGEPLQIPGLYNGRQDRQDGLHAGPRFQADQDWYEEFSGAQGRMLHEGPQSQAGVAPFLQVWPFLPPADLCGSTRRQSTPPVTSYCLYDSCNQTFSKAWLIGLESCMCLPIYSEDIHGGDSILGFVCRHFCRQPEGSLIAIQRSIRR